MSATSVFGSSEYSMTNIRKLELACDTCTPTWRTALGRRDSTRASRFCTITCAMSLLVSGVKVSVSVPVPFDSEVDCM